MTSLGCNSDSQYTNNKSFTKKIISIPIPISQPISQSAEKKMYISIPISNNNDVNIEDEYSLNCNIFNPNKMSPPDLWKNRLQQRVNNYSISKTFNE